MPASVRPSPSLSYAPTLFTGRRRRSLVLMACAAYVLITIARFLSDDLATPIPILYVFPIAVAAIEYEVRGGVLAGILCSITFALWVWEAGDSFGAIPLRVVALVGIGAMIGWLARERNREYMVARAVLDAIPEPASVKDRSGRYLMANPALERMLLQTREELLAAPTAGDQPPDVRERIEAADRAVLESSRPVEFEVEALVPDIGRITTRMLKAPVRDEHGVVVAIVTLTHDITARVEHERDVLRRAEQARAEYERAQVDYERLMRHRLVNPLTVILGAAETMRSRFAEQPANREQLADLILEQVDRLAHIEFGKEAVGDEEDELRARADADVDAIRSESQEFHDAVRSASARHARRDADRGEPDPSSSDVA